MRRAWRRRHGRAPVDELVDLRDGDTIDLRSGSDDDYHCMTIHLGLPAARDDATDAWEAASSLVEYPSDLEEWRADRRREDLEPGHLSAAVLYIQDLDAGE